jgi:hypothetical protein
MVIEEEPPEFTTAYQLWQIIEILKKYNTFQDFYAYRVTFFKEMLYLVTNRKDKMNQLYDLAVIPTDMREFIAAKEKRVIITINVTPPPNALQIIGTIPILKGRSVLNFNFLEQRIFEGKVVQPATFFFTIRSNLPHYEVLTSMIQFDIINDATKQAALEIRDYVGEFTTDVLQIRRAQLRESGKVPPF